MSIERDEKGGEPAETTALRERVSRRQFLWFLSVEWGCEAPTAEASVVSVRGSRAGLCGTRLAADWLLFGTCACKPIV